MQARAAHVQLSRRQVLGGLGAILAAGCAPGVVRDGSPLRRELEAAAGALLLTGVPGPELLPATARGFADGLFGGVVLFTRNVGPTPEATRALCDAIHAAAGRRVLIGVDQEGGAIQTLGAPATAWPAPATLGARARAAGLPDAALLATLRGAALGAELAALGVDLDFAPVLDVPLPGATPVITRRAFAEEPRLVAALGGAFARGLARAGVLACGKHFPGHGAVAADSHVALPRSSRTRAELDACELVPFAALAAELPLIMTAHVVVEAIDPAQPATLSAKVIEGLLRGQLGFGGVVCSDDLGMAAVRAGLPPGPAAVAAVRAGCDLLLFCHEGRAARAAHVALCAEAAKDPVFADKIRTAAARVARLPPPPAVRPGLDVLGSPGHLALAAEP